VNNSSEPSGRERELDALLAELSGNVLDLMKLSTDIDQTEMVVRTLAKLWEFPVSLVPPAPVFSPAWSEEDGDA